MATVAISHTAADETTTVCYNHPDRETGVRCTQCEQPICVACMKPAAVGQLCPACAHQRRPVNYQLTATTLILVVPMTVIVVAAESSLALALSAPLPFFSVYLVLMGGFFAATLLQRLLDLVTHAKRGKTLQLVVGISIGLGALPTVLIALWLFSFMDAALMLMFIGVLAVRAVAHLH